jgi:peroxiredoxin family protein
MDTRDSSNIKKALDCRLSLSKRKEAVGKVKDKSLLVQLTCDTAANAYVRLAACERLDDQALWGRVATEEANAYVRLAACKRVSDQGLLVRLAAHAPDAKVRLAACERLSDLGLLARLAAEDANAEVRLAACERLSDQGLLAQLATDAPDAKVRLKACQGLDDQGLLAQIATEDTDYDVRLAACWRLSDQLWLARLARDASDYNVRVAACKRLSDQGLLAQIATDADADMRLFACEMLSDQSWLARLARDAPDAEVRLTAFSRAFGQLADDNELCRSVVDDCLAQIERHDSYGSRYAVDILVHIADRDPDLIRQLWPQIKSVCHEDNPNSRHRDLSGNCNTHEDNNDRDPHHRDEPNPKLLQRFPAAIRR